MVILQRMTTGDSGTFGVIYWDGGACVTAELPWRDNRRKVSCIPAGKYNVAMRLSPKFGRVYEVTKVPGRSYVLFHSGNFSGDVSKGYASHVEGCILLGNKFGRLQNSKGQLQDAVLASRYAVGRLVRAMGEKPFILDIRDA